MNPFASGRFRGLAVPLLLLLLAFLFLSPGMPPFRVAAPMDQLLVFPPWDTLFPEADPRLRGSDVIFQQLPWHHWMQGELLAGRFPLWVSAPLGGYPLFAYYQAGVLYPLHLLWALLPTGAGFGPLLAIKLWVGGLGMWFFLRALRLHPSASLLGALGFMFSAGLVVWLPWSHTNSYILLPWLCWTAYAWLRERKRAALSWFAFLWACALLGGSPEFFFIVAVCVGMWALGLLLSSPPRAWPRQVVGLALAVGVGTLLSAIQLLPFFESLGISHIATLRPVDVQAAIERARIHLDSGMILNWVQPRWWGQVYDGVLGSSHLPNESNGYVGQIALLGLPLLVVGAVRRRIDLRLAIPWVVLAFLCWIVVYDDALGVWVRRLPGFSQMVNFRFVLGIAFALLVLGALGWDWLAKILDRPATTTGVPGGAGGGRRSIAGTALALALVGASSFFLLGHWLGLVPRPDVGEPQGVPKLGLLFPPNTDYRLYWLSWEAAVLVGIAGSLLLWRAIGPRASLLLGAFLVADLWMLLFTFNPTAPAAWYYPQTSFIRQVTALVPPTERFIAEGEALLTHTGLVYGYRDWRAQEPMFTRRAVRASVLLDPDYRSNPWDRYNMVFRDINLSVAPLLGIRYVVYPVATNPGYWEPDPLRPPFKRLAFTEGLGLWEMEGVPGFAYLSDRVTALPGEEQALAWLKEVTWEEARTYSSIVEAPAEAVEGIEEGVGSPGGSRVIEYEPGHIKVEVEAARRALLVVGESYYPGWRGSVDGEGVQILRANYLSQGVVVAEGRHTIELRYEPDSFRLGGMLSLAGLVGLVGFAFWARYSVGREQRAALSSPGRPA